MSNIPQANHPAASEFQAHFGAQPASSHACPDCDKWQRLCAELLQERDRLKAELAKERAQYQSDMRSLAAVMSDNPYIDLSKEELDAQIDKDSSLSAIIAELEEEAKRT